MPNGRVGQPGLTAAGVETTLRSSGATGDREVIRVHDLELQVKGKHRWDHNGPGEKLELQMG